MKEKKLQRKNTNFYHFHHFGVIKVVNDMLENISVGDEAQSSENDHDRDFLFDVGQNCNDPLADGRFFDALKLEKMRDSKFQDRPPHVKDGE